MHNKYDQQEGEFDIKKEALWVIANTSECSDSDVVRYMIEAGSIPVLAGNLETPDPRVREVVLSGMKNFLRVSLIHEDWMLFCTTRKALS